MIRQRRTKTYPLTLLLERRRRKQVRSEKSFISRSGQAGITLSLILCVVLVATLLLLAGVYTTITADLPSLEQISVLLNAQDGIMTQPTRFYDRSGEHVLYTLENPAILHTYLSVDPQKADHFSLQLVQVVLTLQQPDFWSSPGIRLGHLTDLEAYTLSENLVKQLLFPAGITQTRQALQMRLLAAQVVSEYGRTQVLEWYLNSAYFGHLAFGADSAARLYLGKPASQLDLAESALLAALMKTPALNPLDAPQAALERKDEVLLELLESGQFNEADIGEALSKELVFSVQNEPAKEGEYIRYVLQQLEGVMARQEIERGGLRIITTLDYALQKQVECSVQVQLQRLDTSKQGTSSTVPEGCDAAWLLPTLNLTEETTGEVHGNVLILDPQNGEILAWSGEQRAQGAALSQSAYAPGSLLSPFLATAAFVRGMSPASLVWDVPLTGLQVADETSLQNLYRGPQRLRYALANDYLAALHRLAETIGYDNIWLLANTLGLQSLDRQQVNGNLFSGDESISFPELAQAYATFATLGLQSGVPVNQNDHLQPSAILQVEDIHARVLYQPGANQTRVLLSPGLAYLVHDVLSDKLARQTSLGHPNDLEIGRPAGAKAGRGADGLQTWVVGYTPQLLTLVWVGQTGEAHGSASVAPDITWASGLWHAAMQYALRDQPVEDWQIPADVVKVNVCNPSGQLPTADCPQRVDELFLTGSEPGVADTLYKTYYINRETGKLATVFTPLELVEERIYLTPPVEYMDWAEANGLDLPPSDYDLIQVPDPLPGVEITNPVSFSPIHGTIMIEGIASGDDFESYRLQVGQGLNPRTWVQLGSESSREVTRGVLGEWDTSGLEGLYVIRLTVLRTDNRLETHVIQVSVDNTPPSVSVTYPLPGQEIESSTGEKILLLANASDSIGLKRLTWRMDGEEIGQSSQSPYFLEWYTEPGEHILQVEAIDLAGNRSLSAEVLFKIIP